MEENLKEGNATEPTTAKEPRIGRISKCAMRPNSSPERFSTKRPRVEDGIEEKIADFPYIVKKKRARRFKRAGLEALVCAVEVYSKMEVKSVKATATSVETQLTPEEGVECKKTPTDLVPHSVEQPNHKVLEKSEPSDADLIDFRGLAMLPRRYASLVEKACVRHTNLAICSKKSLKWRQFAFETLGELLFFLTSTKQKEMTHKAYEQLEMLWEDAQSVGFDLSWLAPTVKSELGSSSTLEAICWLEAEKELLKERQTTLHCQLTTLTMQLCETKKELKQLRELIINAKKEAKSTANDYLYTDL